MAAKSKTRRTTRGRRRRMSAAVIAGLLGGALMPGGAAFGADSAGRIQQVETKPGEVSFLFSVPGLPAGATLDPATIKVEVGGTSVPASAKQASGSVSGPARSVALVVDSSGSMGEDGKIGQAKASAKQFLSGLPSDVRVALITFSDSPVVAVAPTTDRSAVTRAIDAITPSGATAMYDATTLALSTLTKEGSRSVLLLSDGADEGSKTTPAAAAAAVKASGATLDAVSLGAGAQVAELRRLSTAGKGVTVTATDAQSLTTAFEAAARAVQNQMIVTATLPSDVAAGTASISASALAGSTVYSDAAIALVQAAPADATAGGPRAVDVSSGGVLGSGWFLPLAITVLFVAFSAIAWFAFTAKSPQGEDSGRISRRLKDAGVAGSGRKARAASTTSLGEGAAVRKAVGMADMAVATRDVDFIDRRLQTAGLPLRPAEWVVINVLVAVVAALVATLLSGFSILWSVLAFGIGLVLPWLVLGIMASRRQKAFYTALPDTLQLLSGSLSAGYSFPQAIDTVAKQSTGPIAEEFNRALIESRLGIPVEEALSGVAERMASKDFDWVVMALRINRKVGGNLAEVLSNVAGTLRERERLRRQVSALSAEGRLSAWVLGLLPIGLFGYLMVANPVYIGKLLDNVVGWLMLLSAAISLLIGILWMLKLSKMEV